MSPAAAAILKEDLVKAVSSPDGVGHGAYIQGASIAGKTGTAELKASKGAEGQENGWFVGFDAKDPQLLIAVMVEDVKSRGGSKYVTPKVKRIFQQALKE
jgi:penicillin-binding protein